MTFTKLITISALGVLLLVSAATYLTETVYLAPTRETLRIAGRALRLSLVATAINPVIGLSSFLAQILLRGPLIAAATKEFRIDGSWSDPQVNAVPSTAKSRAASTPAAPGENPP